MNMIRIELYQNGQELMIHNLIKKVYDEFVSIDYGKEGNQFFYDQNAGRKWNKICTHGNDNSYISYRSQYR
jgi:hypothetical protein